MPQRETPGGRRLSTVLPFSSECQVFRETLGRPRGVGPGSCEGLEVLLSEDYWKELGILSLKKKIQVHSKHKFKNPKIMTVA